MTYTEKLIRDTIPDLPGFSGTTRKASAKELPMLLCRKLQEECDEAIAELLLEDLEALTQELADIFEVILAMAYHNGIEMSDVYSIAETKRSQRGGFQSGLVLTKPSDK